MQHFQPLTLYEDSRCLCPREFSALISEKSRAEFQVNDADRVEKRLLSGVAPFSRDFEMFYKTYHVSGC